MRAFLKEAFNAVLMRGNAGSTPSISIRQIISGGIATTADVGLFQLLLTLGTSILRSSFFSFWAGLITNYTLNNLYVFGHIKKMRFGRARQFVMYFFAGLSALALNQLILWQLAVVLGMKPLYAKLISVFILFWWNQLLARKIIFTAKKS